MVDYLVLKPVLMGKPNVFAAIAKTGEPSFDRFSNGNARPRLRVRVDVVFFLNVHFLPSVNVEFFANGFQLCAHHHGGGFFSRGFQILKKDFEDLALGVQVVGSCILDHFEPPPFFYLFSHLSKKSSASSSVSILSPITRQMQTPSQPFKTPYQIVLA